MLDWPDLLMGIWQMANLYLQLLWPVLVPVVAIQLFRVARSFVKWQRLSEAGMKQIDAMDGKSFEMYLETLFKRQGYRVQRTPYQGDYGADLVVAKNGKKTVVQAKRYKGKVGVKAVQEIATAKGYYKADDALVVTNSVFTAQAMKLAKANDVELWDRQKLAQMVLRAKREQPVAEAVA